MEPHPSPLSDQAAGLRRKAQAPRENRALLPAALHTLIAAIQYVIDHWAYSPYYMRVGGRPLLLFTDIIPTRR